MPKLRCSNAPTPANLFVQLSMRRSATAPSRFPILDLLLPLASRTTSTPSIRAHRAVSTATKTFSAARNNIPWRSAHAPRLPLTAPPLCTFTTSAVNRATHALLNPQLDEDGKEMVLEITPRAAKRLAEIMTKDSNPYLALRIQVESGGCHGFQYLMKLVTLPPSLPTKSSPADEHQEQEQGNGAAAAGEIREDDTIFTYTADGTSSTPDLTAPKIILDLPSLELLKGSKVDFTMELIGSQFKIVDNPLATSSCGCGTSFDIKI
ncbi:Iron-sulfur assembly protein 2 [Madurella mycetomatis]|uniref:Iron-sulfur assembly protein 2 n=1 Tax=Madurella mycetomatis TaxID=100816 RepID=A0A175VT06_9PEZI|nr:Iron-sulfur assembly protein 2 [Madurella mycetomatis]